MTCWISCVDPDRLVETVAGSHRIGSLLEEVDGSSGMAVVQLVEIVHCIVLAKSLKRCERF